jgi:hypothetical protein
LALVEGDYIEPAAKLGFPAAKDRPQFLRIGRGDFFRRILIALPAFDEIESAARVGNRREDGDLFVAVLSQGVDFGKQMACLAGRHIADEQSQKSSAHHILMFRNYS